MSSIYDIPTIWLFFMFILLVVTVSVLGLYLFKMIDTSSLRCKDHNGIVAILMGVMSVFLGVMLSFLIATAWGIYNKADLDNQKEAQAIYVLYEIVNTLPDTEETQALIIEYLEYVINVEFPAIEKGEVPSTGRVLIQEIQRLLYDYVPENPQQTSLYQSSIQLFDIIIDFRTNRLLVVNGGLNSVIWWITLLDSILIIIMSWALACSGLFHYIVVIIVAIYVASGLFTTLVLSNPFRGSSGLTSEPFEFALADIIDAK